MIKKIKRFPKFLKEVKEELKKVNWSKKEEVMEATLLVVVIAGMLTLYIAGIDLGLSKMVQFLFQK
ncbi:MAG TPA: preprotein translocase subunit SecE [Candidatus Omnitrophica bacterium]|jgi:preprotein translocase subunit SecE|nr:preprotein translocase subunit SecE [Candidatus Omnitrophota bacterium]